MSKKSRRGNNLDKGKKFPRKTKEETGNQRDQIDRDLIKKQYLENPIYSFPDFCRSMGYGWQNNWIQGFPVKTWQREWLETRIHEQDESVIPSAVEMRLVILRERVKYGAKAGERYQILDSLTRYVGMQMQRAAQFDMDHAEMIRRNEIQPKFEWKPSDLVSLGMALKMVDELHLRACMVSADKINQSLPISEPTEEDRKDDGLQDRVDNLSAQIMGMENVKPEQLTENLSKWFDQAKMISDQSKEAETVTTEVIKELEDDEE